jgi:integrase
LLEDPDVRRWYDNLARGSRVTADVYLRRLGGFTVNQKIQPRELLSLSDKEISNLLMDFVSWSEKQGHAGSYIRSTLKAVRSWLLHNHRDITVKIKVKGADDTPTLRKERVPTRKELRQIFLSGDKKARVACVLVAHSGLRIGCLGNYRGDDGLRIEDIPELKIKGKEVVFEEMPAMVIVRRELSKAGHRYFTFLSEEGCEYLKDYLEERLRKGEELGPESPVITPKTASKPFIPTTNIGDAIRGAIRKAGFSWRPYVLRSYFDTQLMLAESKGHVLRDYRQFWMGHKGDIENRYTTNKGMLPDEVIEDMRSAYRRSQGYLQTIAEPSSEDKLREKTRRDLLLILGCSPEELEELNYGEMSDEEFQEFARRRMYGTREEGRSKQKVVSIDEIDDYLSQGWEFVANLPNDKAVLKAPTISTPLFYGLSAPGQEGVATASRKL